MKKNEVHRDEKSGLWVAYEEFRYAPLDAWGDAIDVDACETEQDAIVKGRDYMARLQDEGAVAFVVEHVMYAWASKADALEAQRSTGWADGDDVWSRVEQLYRTVACEGEEGAIRVWAGADYVG